jgi:hypothetical protein
MAKQVNIFLTHGKICYILIQQKCEVRSVHKTKGNNRENSLCVIVVVHLSKLHREVGGVHRQVQKLIPLKR